MSPKKKWILASAFVVLIVISIFIYALLATQLPGPRFSMKAVIVDQLAQDSPNPAFRDSVTTLLSDYGFNVSYYNNTDVEFFTHLAESAWGLIILRAHMAERLQRLENGTEVPVAVDMFTSESYDAAKHVAEQNAQLVSRGELNYSGTKYYFAITPLFIQRLQGAFPQSFIVATGCSALKPGLTQLANAFVSKGSKVFIGWTDFVSSYYSDEQTVKVIQELVENGTVSKVARSIIPEGNPWSINGASVDFYPRSAGDMRLSDMVIELPAYKASTSLSIVDWNSGFSFAAVALTGEILSRFDPSDV